MASPPTMKASWRGRGLAAGQAPTREVQPLAGRETALLRTASSTDGEARNEEDEAAATQKITK